MVVTPKSKSADIRARLGHPVIDADGHTVELSPVLREYVRDYVRQIGGGRLADRFSADRDSTYANRVQAPWNRMSVEERQDRWMTAPAHGSPNLSALDRATASLPRLLHQRMDEMGLDFTVLYPTDGLSFPAVGDPELRPVICRALNSFYAELYRDYADRMTPAAVIPMQTPREAIEELEYAVNVLGLKAIMIGNVVRPIPSVQREHPEVARFATRLDTLGIDSEYDYDPFWAKCVELKVAPTSHSGSMGWGSRGSPSSYMYNHIGHFAAGGEAMCKSLFMGGVTKRFPTLRVGFLECGVAWACNLYADLVGHWEKRGPKAWKHVDPEELVGLVAEYGDERVNAKMDMVREWIVGRSTSGNGMEDFKPPEDYWAVCDIEKAEDVRDLFIPHFYFGCEADDPMNAIAFNTKLNPLGARLGAMLSSDLGHWDAPNLTAILAEAYELVEKELMSEEDFRGFVFTNAVKLWAGMNPDFFKATVVEHEVDVLLKQGL